MPVNMISPRSVYYRKPIGRNVLEKKADNDQNNIKNEFCTVSSINNKEIELYVNYKHVVLHHFTAIDQSHIFTGYSDEEILCAAFVCLSHKGSINSSLLSVFEKVSETTPSGVMIFTNTVGKYYGFDTEIMSCKLPCSISHAWPVRNCLLVERTPDKSHHNSLFAMTHVLNEFTPVVFVNEYGHNGFIDDTNFRIVTLCEYSMLILAYDSQEETFLLCKVRDAVKEDFYDLYETNFDGTVTAKSFCSRSTNVATVFKADQIYEDGHVSAEYFECLSPLFDKANIKSIKDLDIRSPMARSLKCINDADLSKYNMAFFKNFKIGFQNYANVTRNIKNIIKQEPLYPKVCLQQLCSFKMSNYIFNPRDMTGYSTPNNNGKVISKHNSYTNGFFAEDFYNRKYLCYLRNVNNTKVMEVVKFNYDGDSLKHCNAKSYKVLDALHLKKLKIIVILEENKSLSLYTGVTLICKISLLQAMIYESVLFGDGESQMISTNDIINLSHLSEPTENGFTIHTQSGLGLRLYLPDIVRFHLVEKCLNTLKTLLPIHIGTAMLCRWYYLNRAVDNNESTSVEWPRFVDFILEHIGFRTESMLGDLNKSGLDGSSINKDEFLTKKVRSDRGLYCIETRAKSRDSLGNFKSLALNISDQLLIEYATTVLYSLHLVYETEKLNYSSSLYLENLASLNCSLAYSIEAVPYIKYYVTDYPKLWTAINKLPSIKQYIKKCNIWEDYPPNWSQWFSSIMDGITIEKPYPIIADLNEITQKLMNLWLIIFRKNEICECDQFEINRHMFKIKFNDLGIPTSYDISISAEIQRVLNIKNVLKRSVCYLSEIRFQLTDLDYINPGLGGIIKVICFQNSSYPPNFNNPNLYRLLGRTDLDKQRALILPIIEESRFKEVITNPPNDYRRLSEIRQNCYSYWSNNVHFARGFKPITRKLRIVDNCYLLSILQDDPIVRLAYPDLRIGEAYKMLQSCSPVELDVSICSNYTTGEGDSPSEALKEELDSQLKIITSQRTFALPFGRGMLGLQILNSNSVTDILHVPLLCLSGKYLLSESGKPHTIENTTSTKLWPNFHNGVAAGFMISCMNHLVDYVWILKQLPSNQLDKIELSPEKAGVLFGLGLNGHLNKVSHVTIGDTIKSMNEMATMAVLIGLSAYNLGSKNLALSKHIAFHYRCLIPEEKDHNETIPSLSQVSAIISAGLLNFKSGDRKMAKIFIEEMGRSREYLTADGSSPVDIELTCSTAGFSVGLIMFQQGDVFYEEYDNEELIRLLNYLKGGYRFPLKETTPSEAPTDAHIKSLLKNNDSKKSQPISHVDNWNSFQTRNPRVLEGEFYNTDITGPGAAVAIGMIFMASGNEIIARQLQCPDTFILLEEIRPILLCFRQIAWGMIMWNSIKASKEWIESSIPKFISNYALIKNPNGINEEYWDTANESYFQLLAGSCFVVGLRYAGTDDNNARDTIIFYINKLLDIKQDSELMQTLVRSQYEWTLSTIFLSACMICAGTGNLELLRIVRVLRSLHNQKEFSNYGVHMSYSMSIGLLFLGGGKLTLSNSTQSAAILLISFFPRFPPNYSGRRYHLQALRHLYVIATRARVLCAVDIDTKTAIPITSKIILKTNEERIYHGCFVYPPEDPINIKQVDIFHDEGKYSPQRYRPGTESWEILLQSFLNGGYFFVKQNNSFGNLKSILGKFSTENMVQGFQLSDFRLLTDFLDDINYAHIFGLSHQRILYHFKDNSNKIKEILFRASTLNLDTLNDVIVFYDWCQERGLMSILTTMLVYMKITLKQLTMIDIVQTALPEDVAFLIRHILE